MTICILRPIQPPSPQARKETLCDKAIKLVNKWALRNEPNLYTLLFEKYFNIKDLVRSMTLDEFHTILEELKPHHYPAFSVKYLELAVFFRRYDLALEFWKHPKRKDIEEELFKPSTLSTLWMYIVDPKYKLSLEEQQWWIRYLGSFSKSAVCLPSPEVANQVLLTYQNLDLFKWMVQTYPYPYGILSPHTIFYLVGAILNKDRHFEWSVVTSPDVKSRSNKIQPAPAKSEIELCTKNVRTTEDYESNSTKCCEILQLFLTLSIKDIIKYNTFQFLTSVVFYIDRTLFVPEHQQTYAEIPLIECHLKDHPWLVNTIRECLQNPECQERLTELQGLPDDPYYCDIAIHQYLSNLVEEIDASV